MKRLVALMMCAVSLGATAQPQILSTQQKVQKEKGEALSAKPHKNAVKSLPLAAQATPIWADDVSDCGNWTFDNGATEAGAPWFDTDINFACSTVGPAGLFNQWAGGNGDGSAAPALNSTTAENGFLIVDSDLFGGDINYGANWVENCWVQTAEPVDCSAYPYVSMAFQTRYRCWDNGSSDGSEKCFVEISRDGITWPTLTNTYVGDWQSQGLVNYEGEFVQCRFEVFPNSETGYQTEDPSIVELNITEAAGGQGTVWIRFRWVGTWGYSWEIDDVQLYETPENDIRIDNYLSFTNYAQTGVYEYGAWPLNQIPDNLEAGVEISNVGYANQSSVSVDLDVNGVGFTSNIINNFGAGNETDTLVVSYQPSGLGSQTLNYLLSADMEDENPSDNSAVQSFEITELQFGRDNGVISGVFPVDGTSNYIAMPLFDIVNDVTIYGVDVAIMNGSEGGTPVRALLYNPTLTSADPYGGVIVESETVELDQGYTNSIEGDVVWYTILFEQPYEATAGESIGAAFEHFGGANIQIGEAQYVDNSTAFVYGPFGGAQFIGWYYTNEVPMVRLNLNPNAQPPSIFGCTDTEACNYIADANVEDGTCDYDSCQGCTDDMACNYDSSATIDDGLCSYDCYGCTDTEAINYIETATIDDGSCTDFEASCALIGNAEWSELPLGIQASNPLIHLFATEVSQEVVLNIPSLIQEPVSGTLYNVLSWSDLSVTGMPSGLSFSELPLIAEGGAQYCLNYSGVPVEEGEFEVDLGGDLTVSFFGNPLSIGLFEASFTISILANPGPIPGCTYSLATNYSPFATAEDGSCVFAGCTNPNANNFQMFATFDDGSCDLTPCSADCPSDLDGDGSTGTTDLLQFLGSFGLICSD